MRIIFPEGGLQHTLKHTKARRVPPPEHHPRALTRYQAVVNIPPTRFDQEFVFFGFNFSSFCCAVRARSKGFFLLSLAAFFDVELVHSGTALEFQGSNSNRCLLVSRSEIKIDI